MSSAVPHVYVKRIVVESITRSATDKSAELTFDLNFCLKFPATANPLVADGFFSPEFSKEARKPKKDRGGEW